MNSKNTHVYSKFFWLIPLSLLLTACGDGSMQSGTTTQEISGQDIDEVEPEKGPHGGRLLKDGDFTLELSIFETGVPPEFRIWTTWDGKPLDPENVDVTVNLSRLGGKVDRIRFKPQGDALRGDTVIYEPHSFVVTVKAVYDGATHTWEYDNFEGRTKIEDAVADALEIRTEIAGPVVIPKFINVYGKITPNIERQRQVSARFEGVINSVFVSQGEKVRKGQKLASIESNESLKLYTIYSPIDGVIAHRNANPGEQTDGRQLFIVLDTSSVWAELAVFPNHLPQVKIGAPVTVTSATTGRSLAGKLTQIDSTLQANQATMVRAVLDNPDGDLMPGSYVTARIKVGEHPADLAVKRTGLQSFRDFTVVYAKFGEQYEVRMLELGLQSGEWVEVLGGLEPGTRYVSENSYVIKADIEKSGASHDH